MVLRHRSPVTALTVFTAFLLHGSGANSEQLGELSQPIIYGNDDRIEVYEVDNELLRRRAELSTVSFMFRRSLDYQSDGSVALLAPPYDAIYGLCSDEPFAGQPAAAWCTGVLIDDDLVLTAGHCLGVKNSQVELTCASLAITFGYYLESAESLASIRTEDIFRCRRVVTWRQNSRDLNEPDYAILQLDRAAAPRFEPVPIRLSAVEVGESVAVVTHGAGLPAKVDQGGSVSDVTTFLEYFRANTDTFEGASGSPVYDANSELVAVHTRGNKDWNDSSVECVSAVRVMNGAEDHQVVATPLAQLCELEWPSVRLCGVEPACGDGVCSSQERNSDCSEDCAKQQCGDGICERDEPETCRADCDAYSHVPAGWRCAPEYYQDANGCDCGCGAWDPDCDDSAEPVYNCGDSSVCLDGGVCEQPLEVLDEDDGWGCSTAVIGETTSGTQTAFMSLAWGLLVLLRRYRRPFAKRRLP